MCQAHVLESQILQILGFAALAGGAEELVPEGVIVTPGADRQGHGDAPTEQEHFLPGLQARQHAAQGFAPGISQLLQNLKLARLSFASEFLILPPVSPNPP